MAFAAAFEGEIIRRGAMQVEFNSKSVPTVELVVMKDAAEIEDHKITVVGGDIDSVPVGSSMPLGVLVEVGGDKMQADFEPVIERKLHYWYNYMEGVMHTGQRNLLNVRVSKDAFEKGLRLKDFGEVIWCEVMDEFEHAI